ncbi:MAG: hypothetical protein ACD_67C00058G0001 [uncultured bacterium]|nr:MAG: hypothetical protein ACD_67C00058G0001 [uncultured bacterium]
MKKIIIVVLALSIVGVFEKSSSAEVTFSERVLTKYVSDAGVVFVDEPVTQSDVSISVKNGAYLGFFYSTSLENFNSDKKGVTETDPYAGWKGSLVKVNINAGATYFNLNPAWKFQKEDAVQLHLEVSKKFQLENSQSLTMFARIENKIAFKGEGCAKNLHLHSYARHDWTIASKVTVSQKVGVGFDNGAKKKNPALLGSYEMKISYPLGKKVSIDFSERFIAPMWHKNDKRERQIVSGCGISMKF